VGDLVTFGRYAPMIFDVSELQSYGIPYAKTDDEEYLLLNEEDALCILLKDGEAAIQ